MNNMRLLRAVGTIFLCPAALVTVSGCLAKPPPPATTAPDTSVSLSIPTLVALPTTPESQSKGGLTIAVAPATYTTQMVKAESLQAVRRHFGEPSMNAATGERMVSAIRTVSERPVVTPSQLKFTVTINNQMARVFHGNGTVVQFNVGGHLLAVDQAGYAPLQNAIVPPGSQQQIDILGPTLDKLPPGQTTLGLFFYDVVTGQDAAGVVTEKQNYTWDYTLNTTPQSVSVPGGTSGRVVMPLSEYQATIQRLRAQPGGMPGAGGDLPPDEDPGAPR